MHRGHHEIVRGPIARGDVRGEPAVDVGLGQQLPFVQSFPHSIENQPQILAATLGQPRLSAVAGNVSVRLPRAAVSRVVLKKEVA